MFEAKLGGAPLFSFGSLAVCAASNKTWKNKKNRTRLSVGKKQYYTN